MLAQERHAVILEMLRERSIIKISDIAKRFGVSNLTARRDLDALQDQNLIRRVYGGAVLLDAVGESVDVGATFRRRAAQAEVRAIGKAAAAMVQEGDILFLGTGTTVLEVARQIRHLSNLTVITGSLAVINELADTGNTLYVLGGKLDKEEHSFGGSNASQMLQTFCADKAFVGCGGVSMTHGVTDYSTRVADIDRLMVQQASRAIMVCASHKFGNTALSVVCPLSDLDMIITDDGISPRHCEALRRQGVELRTVPVDGEGENT